MRSFCSVFFLGCPTNAYCHPLNLAPLTCELYVKPIDPNSLISLSLVGTGHGLVMVTLFLPQVLVHVGASRAFKRSPQHTTGEPRFLLSHAHYSTPCAWRILLASGSTHARSSVKLTKLPGLHGPLRTPCDEGKFEG